MTEAINKKTAPQTADSKTENDAVVYHRLLKEDEDKIYAFIRSRSEAADRKAGNSRQTKSLRDFEESLMKTSGDHLRPNIRGQKRLCYEHIPTLLDIAKTSYLELINEISVDPEGNRIEAGWATEQEARMCALCDLLAEKDRDYILDLVRELASEEVRKLNLENRKLPSYEEIVHESRSLTAPELQPIDKISIAGFLRSFGERGNEARTKEMGVSESYSNRFRKFRFNVIGLSLLAYAAIESDISLHWLLGLDESTALLAKNGRTETIMAYFCLLPDDRKNIVMEAISHI